MATPRPQAASPGTNTNNNRLSRASKALSIFKPNTSPLPSPTYPTQIPLSHPALTQPPTPSRPDVPSVYVVSPPEDGSAAVLAFDARAPPSPNTPDIALLQQAFAARPAFPRPPPEIGIPKFRRLTDRQMRMEGVVMPRRRQTAPLAHHAQMQHQHIRPPPPDHAVMRSQTDPLTTVHALGMKLPGSPTSPPPPLSPPPNIPLPPLPPHASPVLTKRASSPALPSHRASMDSDPAAPPLPPPRRIGSPPPFSAPFPPPPAPRTRPLSGQYGLGIQIPPAPAPTRPPPAVPFPSASSSRSSSPSPAPSPTTPSPPRPMYASAPAKPGKQVASPPHPPFPPSPEPTSAPQVRKRSSVQMIAKRRSFFFSTPSLVIVHDAPEQEQEQEREKAEQPPLPEPRRRSVTLGAKRRSLFFHPSAPTPPLAEAPPAPQSPSKSSKKRDISPPRPLEPRQATGTGVVQSEKADAADVPRPGRARSQSEKGMRRPKSIMSFASFGRSSKVVPELPKPDTASEATLVQSPETDAPSPVLAKPPLPQKEKAEKEKKIRRPRSLYGLGRHFTVPLKGGAGEEVPPVPALPGASNAAGPAFMDDHGPLGVRSPEQAEVQAVVGYDNEKEKENEKQPASPPAPRTRKSFYGMQMFSSSSHKLTKDPPPGRELPGVKIDGVPRVPRKSSESHGTASTSTASPVPVSKSAKALRRPKSLAGITAFILPPKQLSEDQVAQRAPKASSESPVNQRPATAASEPAAKRPATPSSVSSAKRPATAFSDSDVRAAKASPPPPRIRTFSLGPSRRASLFFGSGSAFGSGAAPPVPPAPAPAPATAPAQTSVPSLPSSPSASTIRTPVTPHTPSFLLSDQPDLELDLSLSLAHIATSTPLTSASAESSPQSDHTSSPSLTSDDADADADGSTEPETLDGSGSSPSPSTSAYDSAIEQQLLHTSSSSSLVSLKLDTMPFRGLGIDVRSFGLGA